MSRKLLVLLSLCVFNFSYAQKIDLENFEPLKSEGSVPARLSTPVADQFAKWKEKQGAYESSREQQITESFYLASLYSGYKLMLGGRVLFNNPVGTYCNKIRKKLNGGEAYQLYVFKSNSDEVFSLMTGDIFISTGTIARTETEAELAFMIAREIVHLEKKHSLKNALKDKNFLGGGLIEKDGYNILDIVYTTKEQDDETDSEALEIIDEAGYNLEGALSYLENLLEHNTFADVEFDSSFIKGSTIILPSAHYVLPEEEEEGEKEKDKSQKDSRYEERKENIEEGIMNKGGAGGSDFIVSEKDFELYRDAARFESCRISLVAGNPVRAFYEAYSLLKDYPKNLYVQKLMAKSLYVISCYANRDKISDILPITKLVKGNYKTVVHFMNKVSAAEMNVIAANNIWQLKLKNKEDKELDALSDEIVRNLVKYHYSSRKSFKKELDSGYYSMKALFSSDEAEEEEEEVKDEKAEEDEEDNKSKKKKKENKKYKKAKSNRKGVRDHLKYSFVKLLKKKEFRNTFDHYVTLKKKELKEYKEPQGNSATAINALKTHGYALDVDTVLVPFPHFYHSTEKKRYALEHLTSLEREQALIDYMKECSEKLGSTVYCELGKQAAKDAETLNDLAMLTEWTWERTYSDVVRLNLFQDQTARIVEKYNTSHIAYITVNSIKNLTFSEDEKSAVFMSILYLPFLPFTLGRGFHQDHDLSITVSVYNLTTGNVEMDRRYDVPSKYRSTTMKALVYDVLYQIQTDKKGVRLVPDSSEMSMLTEKDISKITDKNTDNEDDK